VVWSVKFYITHSLALWLSY